MRIHLLIAVMTLQWLPLNAVAQVACGLPLKGTQSSQCTEDEEKAGKKSCPRTLVYDKQAIVFATGFRVNTDGNLRSYSAGDPRGTRCADLPETADPLANGCAMNTVCNGASVLLVKGGTTIVLPGHKEGDKTACSTMVKQFERIRDAKPKWLPKDGSRVSFGGVIATKGDKGDNRHVPCETDGFLVSMASTRSGVKPKDRCDQAQWLDAAVPSIVVPQCWSAKYREKNPDTCAKHLHAKDFPDVRPGDLVVARRREPSSKPIFVLVGDTGPNAKIGEASVGFHLQRLGVDLSKLPRTYRDAVRLDVFELRFDVVVFPGTALSGVALTPGNFSKIGEASSATFAKWGGSETGALSKLAACALQAAP